MTEQPRGAWGLVSPRARHTPRRLLPGSRDLGGVLRAIREERGQSRERLAVAAGLTVGTLARLELGQTDPAWSTIVAVADALELKLADLAKLVEDARGSEG
jgi:transcriptional regulator with XRE-family HTH domain